MESSNFSTLPDPSAPLDAQLRRLNDHASAVHSMTATPGWAVFVQATLAAIKVAKASAAKVPEPHRMAMLAGAALALEDMLDWPRRELEKARLGAESLEDLDSKNRAK